MTGGQAELLFRIVMEKHHKEVVRSSIDVDMIEHIDFIVDGLSYDVKAEKLFRRGDPDSGKVIWIEHTNVNGQKGWLRGEADYISFLVNKEFWIVNRKKLIIFVKENITDNIVYNTKKYKKWYTRPNRKDILAFFKTEDVSPIVEKKYEIDDESLNLLDLLSRGTSL